MVANRIAPLDRVVAGAVAQVLGKRLGQIDRTIGRSKGQQPSTRVSRGSPQAVPMVGVLLDTIAMFTSTAPQIQKVA